MKTKRSAKESLSPSLSGQNRSMYWVIATLAVAALPQLALMPFHLAIACVLPMVWRILAQVNRWQPLPAWARFTAVGLGLASLAVSYGGLFGRRASVSLLTVMLALKLL